MKILSSLFHQFFWSYSNNQGGLKQLYIYIYIQYVYIYIYIYIGILYLLDDNGNIIIILKFTWRVWPDLFKRSDSKECHVKIRHHYFSRTFPKLFRWISVFLGSNDFNCKLEFLSLPYIHPQPPSTKWTVLWPSGLVCSLRSLWSLVLFSSHLWHTLLVVLTRQIDIRGLLLLTGTAQQLQPTARPHTLSLSSLKEARIPLIPYAFMTRPTNAFYICCGNGFVLNSQ